MKLISRQYNSINEFISEIKDREYNKVFKDKGYCIASNSVGANASNFTGTKTIQEAYELLKYGWNEPIERINKALIKGKIGNKKTIKSEYSVAGYQASVPRYLQGIPTAMVNSKMVTKKQPIITLSKSISYNCGVNKNQIIEESIKALQIVNMIEASGTRVNLNIIFPCKEDKEKVFVRLKIKSANERMNISKLTFPMAHPSMLRRLFLRYLETEPELTELAFSHGHGIPMQPEEIKPLLNKNEYLLPAFIDDIEKFIKTLV